MKVSLAGLNKTGPKADLFVIGFSKGEKDLKALRKIDPSFAKSAEVLLLKATELQTYPVVVATTCSEMGIGKQEGLLAYLQAFSNNLIAVALRLVPLGQTNGLEIMRELMPAITRTATRATTSTLGDLGSSTLLSDIASMKHEIQYSRVFRS